MKQRLMIFLCVFAPLVQAAGTGGGGQATQVAEASAAESAAAHYRSGLRYKRRAWNQEENALGADSPAEREGHLAMAQRNYSRAADQFRKALAADQRHAEAATELGYALRRTGRYGQAIEWYDHALRMNPELLEAVEYRGEAYLETGQLEAAKIAYMELFRGNSELADQLLVAMEAWVSRAADPDPSFSEWVVERRALRELTESEVESRPASW